MSVSLVCLPFAHICLRRIACDPNNKITGDTGTIDDNYRSIWPYIWGNPEALNAMQRPLNLFNDHQT